MTGYFYTVQCDFMSLDKLPTHNDLHGYLREFIRSPNMKGPR